MGIEKELCVVVADSKHHRWKVSTELLWWVALVSLGGIKCNRECEKTVMEMIRIEDMYHDMSSRKSYPAMVWAI